MRSLDITDKNGKDYKLPRNHLGYDEVQVFERKYYDGKMIIYECSKDVDIPLVEVHVDKKTLQVISETDRKRNLIGGVLDYNDEYYYVYNRVIKDYGVENENYAIFSKQNSVAIKSGELYLANRLIQTDQDRISFIKQKLAVVESRKTNNKFMHDTYKNWSVEKKIDYWYSTFIFLDKMQTQVNEGVGNIGLYKLSKEGKEYLIQFEDDWDLFIKLYSQKFIIPINVVRKMFELKRNSFEWEILARGINNS
ncbi:hypothetical protein [Lewinella sp. 4G2]|uniref:hypothetical protein n=1 Tax=Lewinella sp. 4G2 TaxID=1803372 RepID=UPI0007B4B184|nr:hypothetical protein [Lewinella sp. 4G2]OAV45103.1 hypothetical protein A3850_011655 [Lewinella sp. 4G2]